MMWQGPDKRILSRTILIFALWRTRRMGTFAVAVCSARICTAKVMDVAVGSSMNTVL